MRKDETRVQGTPVVDVNMPVETSARGDVGLAVNIQDQTTPVLSVPFLRERTGAVLSANLNVGDRIVNLVAGHGAVVGDIIELGVTGSQFFLQSRVLAVNTNALTIDQPVNYPYTTVDTTVILSTDNMLVDGSSTPVIFSIKPSPGQLGDVVRMISKIISSSAMDFETFGSGPALTNGCVLRVLNGDGNYTNIFNFKTNADLITQGFDHSFLENIGQNNRAFTNRITWGGQNKHGVVIRLDGDLGEELQIVIQDNLTTSGNTQFTMRIQGHTTQV